MHDILIINIFLFIILFNLIKNTLVILYLFGLIQIVKLQYHISKVTARKAVPFVTAWIKFKVYIFDKKNLPAHLPQYFKVLFI